MPPSAIEAIRYTVAGLFCLSLMIAAVSDIRTRLIPNWTVLAVLVLSLGSIPFGPSSSFVAALESGAIALAVTVGLHAFGFIGAGDSKLFSAVAVFVGLHLLAQFAVMTSIAGGVLALLMLMLNPLRAMTALHLKSKGSLGNGIPYGVAIALAGIAVTMEAILGLPPLIRF